MTVIVNYFIFYEPNLYHFNFVEQPEDCENTKFEAQTEGEQVAHCTTTNQIGIL